MRPSPADCKIPIDGYLLPAGTAIGQGPRLVIVLEATRPGAYASTGFVLHYHVGPINYSTTYGTEVVVHASQRR
jgi:hypothetical protein